MDNKEITRRAHDAIAKQYYEAYKDDTTDLMYFDKYLSLFDGSILDLGCGMGHYSRYMYNKGYDVVGVDFSSEMIKLAKENNDDIEFIEHDICDLSFLNGRRFDGIVIAYVLQHLSKEEVLTLFGNIDSFVNDESKLLLFLRAGDSVIKEIEPMNSEYEYVINEYNKDSITKILNDNNWSVLSIEEKEFVDDPNSLAPNTLVVIAERMHK